MPHPFRQILPRLAALALLAGPATLSARPDPAAAPPAPRIRAVLVGVAEYRDVTLSETPLLGARNDAMLMAETLLRRGAKAEDIVLLVDHPETAQSKTAVPSRGSPTRTAILAALAEMAAGTRPGDEVVVQFSGHGDQQHEAVPGNEPDGRDETFLPADAAYDPAKIGDHETPVKNAIIDDEIGRALDAIRGKGGNVFFIADFCHSGDSTRGGVATETAATRQDRPVESAAQRPGMGTLVSFFTARSDEQGGQRATPYWDLSVAEVHGVLTYYTITALNDPTVGTYDDLFERVNTSILASNVALAGSNPPASLPAPEGPTNQPVLGRRVTGPTRPGWSVLKPPSDTAPVVLDHLDLPAGSVAGVTAGTIFSIAAVGQKDEVILYGKADAVKPWTTTIVPVTYGGIDKAAWRDVKATDFTSPEDGRVPFTRSAPLFIRAVERPVASELRVALPPRATAISGAQRGALDALAALDQGQLGVRFVGETARSNLVLRFAGDTLDFRTSARPIARSYGRITLGGDGATIGPQLAAALLRAARFHRVQAILSDMAAQPQSGDAPSALLDVQFFLRRPSAEPRGECSIHAFQAGDPIPGDARPVRELGYSMTAPPQLHRCDEIYVAVRNTGTRPVHVSPMILAPEGAIYFLPTQDNDRVLYEPGRSGTAQYVLTTDVGGEPGRDDLTFIVLEVDPNHQSPAIRHSLEQPGIVCADPREAACQPDASRGSAPDAQPEARQLLTLLDGTRSASAGIPRVGIRHFSWDTIPDPAASPAK